MIHPSPELLAVSRRWYDVIRSRQTSGLKEFLYPGEELRFVGSGDDEYWSGQMVRDGIADFFGEAPQHEEWSELEAEAFELGSCGWSSFTHRIKFAGMGAPRIHRTTLVFVLEGAGWRIVQRHSSVPTPNTTLMGIKQDAIQRLVDAAQKGFSLTQRAGLASVMFTDIVGSSALAAALGDAAWSRRISAHFTQARKIIETAGGQFVKSLGDGTLSSFPSARAAMQAAMTLQRAMDAQSEEPLLSLRIGLHTGDVVQADDDFFGSVVNKAARITALAGAGDIAVSEVTRAMVGSTAEFAFSDSTQETLRGFDGSYLIYRLEWRQ